MPEPVPRRRSSRAEGRGLRDRLLLASALLFSMSILPFGAVHPGWRMLLATATAGLGATAILARTRAAPLTRRALLLAAVLMLSVTWAALGFLPVGAEQRVALQPAVAGPVNAVLAAVGGERHPLALDPWRGLVEWGVFAGAAVLALGIAELVRHTARARRLALVVVAAAIGFAVLGLAQALTGAHAIYWVSELPHFHELHSVAQRRFFGTMVSPNHAGVLLAASLPLAVALLRQHGTTARAVGLAGVVLLGLGIAGTASRGAVLEGATALLVFAALASGRAGRTVLAVLVGLGILILAWRGPQTVAFDLTAVIDPIAARDVAAGWTDLATGRAELYADSWKLVADGPLVGVGPAGFDDAYVVVKSTPGFAVSSHAHQEALQVAAEFGLPALVTLLGALLVLAAGLPAALDAEHPVERRWLACGFAGSLAAILVAACFDFPFRSGTLSTLTALSVGGLAGLSAHRLKPGTSRSDARWRAGVWTGATLLMAAGAVLAVVVALAAGGGRTPYAEADRLVADGDAALAAGDVDGAVAAWQAAARAQPVRRDALQKLAGALEKRGDSDAAVAVLRATTGIYPTLPWPWRDLARLERRRGDFGEAMEAWREMLTLDLPGDAVARRAVREALDTAAEAGLPDPLSQALGVLPGRGDRWRDAAELAEAMGADPLDVEGLYQEAIALDPGQRVGWAATLLRRGRPADAVSELGKAKEDGYDGCRARLLGAEAAWQLDGCSGYAERAQRADELCPAGDLELRVASARGRVCAGESRSDQVLEKLLADAPGLDKARHLLVDLLLARNRSEDARRHLEVLEQRGKLTGREAGQLARIRDGKPLLPEP